MVLVAVGASWVADELAAGHDRPGAEGGCEVLRCVSNAEEHADMAAAMGKGEQGPDDDGERMEPADGRADTGLAARRLRRRSGAPQRRGGEGDASASENPLNIG